MSLRLPRPRPSSVPSPLSAPHPAPSQCESPEAEFVDSGGDGEGTGRGARARPRQRASVRQSVRPSVHASVLPPLLGRCSHVSSVSTSFALSPSLLCPLTLQSTRTGTGKEGSFSQLSEGASGVRGNYRTMNYASSPVSSPTRRRPPLVDSEAKSSRFQKRWSNAFLTHGGSYHYDVLWLAL